MRLVLKRRKEVALAIFLAGFLLFGCVSGVRASSSIYGVSWDWEKDSGDYEAEIAFSFKTTDGNCSVLKFELTMYAGGEEVGDKYLTHSNYVSGDVVSKTATVDVDDDISYDASVRLWIKAYNGTIASAYEIASYTERDDFPYNKPTTTAAVESTVSTWTAYALLILGVIGLAAILIVAYRFLSGQD